MRRDNLLEVGKWPKWADFVGLHGYSFQAGRRGFESRLPLHELGFLSEIAQPLAIERQILWIAFVLV